MKPTYLLSLLLLLAIINPASAITYDFTAPANKAVWSIDISAPMESTGTITIYQYGGGTTTASWSTSSTLGVNTVTETIGSGSASFTYFTPGNIKFQIWNGDNQSGSRQLKMGMGQFPPVWNQVAVTTISSAPIMRYTATTSSGVTFSEEVISTQEAQAKLDATDPEKNNDYVAYVLSLVWMFVGFVVELVFWLKFFFVDNLLLLMALYLGLTGVMAFTLTKGNIFNRVKKFINYQKKFFEFIMSLWDLLIRLASYIRGLFKFV